MSVVHLPNGLTVRTFKQPPEEFNPLKAEDRELAVYGFPKRPEDPALLDRWEQVLGRPIRLVRPTFRAMDYKRRRLPKRARAGAAHGVEATDIWSGAVVHAPAGDSFKWVEGTWTVPDAYPPPSAGDGVWYSASTWVGIDGIDGSGDVLQAGCDSDVMTSGGNVQRQLNPWWEWYPAGSFWISNLPVAPGDTLNCLICVTEGSTTSAAIFLYNVTSGQAANFHATAPDGTTLAGNTAEWVVERLEIDSNTPELARYGDVYFDEANAGTVGGATLHAGAGNTINMVDGGNVISTGTIESSTLVQVKYTGPH
jgi:peptidase A4-like protein